jgi:hypothetical protein
MNMNLPFNTEKTVLKWKQVGNKYLVIFDYMEFPSNAPARNLYAFTSQGRQLWIADSISKGNTDAYTNFISEQPLIVGNFAGYNVTINIRTGKVLKTQFTK